MNNPLCNWQDSNLLLPESLCLHDCEAIDWACVQFPAAEVIVDASALKQIDSIGIAALLVLLRRAQAQQITLYWHNLSDALMRMLAVYELDKGVFLTCRNN